MRLQTQKEITFMNLSRAVEKEVNGNFEGSVTWYVTTVKLDLEARGEIKRVPNSRPQLVKLVIVSRVTDENRRDQPSKTGLFLFQVERRDQRKSKR